MFAPPVTPSAPTRWGRIGRVVIVIFTMAVSTVIVGRTLYLKRLRIPAFVWIKSKPSMPTPPSFAYDHTPQPPRDDPQNPIDVLSYDSMLGLTVKNLSNYSMYIIDLRIAQELETTYNPLGFEVLPGKAKDFSLKPKTQFRLTSISALGNTWKDHVQAAIKQYNPECLAYVYFSPNDSGLITMEEHYKQQGTALGMGEATGVIRYRLSNSSKDMTQTTKLVVMTMRNELCVKPPS